MNEIIRGLRQWGYHPHVDNDLGRIRIRLPYQQDAVYVGSRSNWSFSGEMLKMVDDRNEMHDWPKASEFKTTDELKRYRDRFANLRRSMQYNGEA